MPEPCKNRGGAEFPRLALLTLGDLQGRPEGFLGGGVIARLGQLQLASQAVQFSLEETLVILLDERQALIERSRCVIEPSGLRKRTAKESEVKRQVQRSAGGAKIVNSLLKQGQRFFPLPLCNQRRSLEQRRRGQPVSESLLGRDDNLFLSSSSSLDREPTLIVQPGPVLQRERQRKRLAELPCQRDRFLAD